MQQGALYAAAECISAIEDFALDLTTSIVATVSKLDIARAARDVIPGSIKCTLDIKSADTVRLTFACNALQNIFSEICDDRKIAFNWSTICETDPIACDTNLTNLLKQSIKNAGIDVVELVSGTSHNALPMAAICPVSILRMRCVKVISDAAAKDAEIKDIAASIEVAENFILNMAPMYN